MQYSDVQKFLGEDPCKACSESSTRIRRESSDCVALWYSGAPILKWLSNGDIIVHCRGTRFTDAAISRILNYAPSGLFGIIRLRGRRFTGSLPNGWNWKSSYSESDGGFRFSFKTKTVHAVK